MPGDSSHYKPLPLVCSENGLAGHDSHHHEHHKVGGERAACVHSHRHSDHGCVHSHSGWRQFLPHAHGLHSRLERDSRALLASLAVVVFTCCTQFIAGAVARSSALVTEGVHSALDGLSVVIALVAVLYSSRPPTPHMTYGYARAETLAAVVSILLLFLLCVKLLVGAIERLWHVVRGTTTPIFVEGKVVFIAEAVTLASNVSMACLLTKYGGRPSAIDLEDASMDGAGASETMSLNLRALRAHILADCVENAVILFAGLLMWLVPAASMIDPVLTLLIVAALLYLNAPIAREVTHIILQGAPSACNGEDVTGALVEIRDVVSCRDVHIWTLTSARHVATATVEVAGDCNIDAVERVRRRVRRVLEEFGASDVTVEVVRATVRPASHISDALNGVSGQEDLLLPLEIEMDDLDDDAALPPN